MHFRQDETEKRTTDESLLPLSITYEDTYVDEGEEDEYFDVFFYDRATPERRKHKKSDDIFRFDGYVLSPGLARAIKSVAPYAIANEPILIEGAAGTGKETLARSIHQSSGLSGPFVCIDCGSYTPAEFERAMSGTRARTGLVKRAEGGSLYLKDIEKLTLSMQELLFELLKPVLNHDDDDDDVEGDEEGEGYSSGIRGIVERTGDFVGSRLPGTNSEEDDDDEDEDEDEEAGEGVEMQIISSCSPDIKLLLAKKKFSRDLYRALKEGYAVLPALRDHPASILPLFKQFVESTGKVPGKAGKKAKSFGQLSPTSYAKDVNATLIRFKWPANYDDLIRCAAQVRHEVGDMLGLINSAMIKKCLSGQEKSEVTNVERTISNFKTSPAPSSSGEQDIVGNSKTQPMNVIVPDKQLGPVIGINMSRAWEKQHDNEYQRLKLDNELWESTIKVVEQAARKLSDSMFNGESGVLKRALKDNWKGEFKRVLIARWVILVMEKHVPDHLSRMHRLGWLEEPKAGKDYQKKFGNYRQYCFQLGFVQPKQGNVLDRSFIWPEEQAWLDEYMPPR